MTDTHTDHSRPEFLDRAEADKLAAEKAQAEAVRGPGEELGGRQTDD